MRQRKQMRLVGFRLPSPWHEAHVLPAFLRVCRSRRMKRRYPIIAKAKPFRPQEDDFLNRICRCEAVIVAPGA